MQIDLNTLYILAGFAAIVAGGVVWITSALGRVRIELAEIKENMKNRPHWGEMRALNDGALSKVEALQERVAKLEFQVNGTDRRKDGG